MNPGCPLTLVWAPPLFPGWATGRARPPLQLLRSPACWHFEGWGRLRGSQQPGRPCGRRSRKHTNEPAFGLQPSGASRRAAGLRGRGLADAAQFPLTGPRTPALPGWASNKNKKFSLGPAGLVRWVTEASLAHLSPLGPLQAGLDAPHCSLGSPRAHLGI